MAEPKNAQQSAKTTAVKNDGKRLYSVDEAAEHLGLNRAEVYRRVVDGHLKGEKHERTLLFLESELNRYLDEQSNAENELSTALRDAITVFTQHLRASDRLGEPESLPEHTDAQVEQLGHLILRKALLEGISDLYLDPLHDGARLLAGREGNCCEQARFSPPLTEKLMAWISQLAPLGDGHTPRQALGQHVCDNRSFPFHLTAIPTLLGELLHLYFPSEIEVTCLEDLGYLPAQSAVLTPILSGQPGLVVVAAPPGPSTDSHMRNLAHLLATNGRLVVCLHKRVSFRNDLLVQLESGERGDFATLWHAALAMRPSVILVEEGVEMDSVCPLIQAANAGILVIAFTRSSGVRDALAQLLKADVDKNDFSRVLLGAIETVTMRQLCPHCRLEKLATGPAAALFGIDQPLAEATGCPRCGDGYLGYRTVNGVWRSSALLSCINGEIDRDLSPDDERLSLSTSAQQAVLDLAVHWTEAQRLISSQHSV